MIKKTEKGQIIVLVALSMVVLLGFTAVAIDGSNIYRARRMDQGTADSTALAAAGAAGNYIKTYPGFLCGSATDTTAQNLAKQKAHNVAATIKNADGAFVNMVIGDLSTNNGVVTTCKTNPNGSAYIEIHTAVSSTAKTFFLKVLSKTPVTTNVDAIAKVTSSTLGSLLQGQGIVSLDSTGCGMDITSTPVKVTGGGIFDNSDLCSNWAPNFNTTACIGVHGAVGHDFTNGSQTITGPGFCSPKPPLLTTSAIITMFSAIPAPPAPPSCSSYRAWTWAEIVAGGDGLYCFSNNKSLSLSYADAGGGANFTQTIPGNVQLVFSGTGGMSINGGTNLTLNFGSLEIWMANGGFNAGGTTFSVPNTFRLYSTGTSTSPSITFNGGSTDTFGDAFFYINAAKFSLPGSVNFIANAPTMGSYKGIIIYAPITNTNTIVINGGGNFSTTGSFLAPGATIQLNGSSTTSVMNSQIVGNNITVAGGSTINVLYDPNLNYSGDGQPITIDILK